MKPVYWIGKVEDADDFLDPISDIFIDGRTKMGPWAIMTPKSWAIHGVGLGTGFGQKYQRQSDNQWLKVEG